MAENATGEPYDVICGSILNPTTAIRSYIIDKDIQKIDLPSDCWLRSHLFVTPKMTIRSGLAHITPELNFSNITFDELNSTINRRQTPWQIGPRESAADAKSH